MTERCRGPKKAFQACSTSPSLTTREQATVRRAIRLLERGLRQHGHAVQSPCVVSDYLKLHLMDRPHESFCVMFLDARHQLIEMQEMFRGTIDGATVYPREVVKTALALNAAAVILAHNHPSGVADASEADRGITEKLRKALALVEIRVLDHVVVAGKQTMSFAERGLI